MTPPATTHLAALGLLAVLLTPCATAAQASSGAGSAGERPDGVDARTVTLEVMTFNIRTSEGRDGPDAWPHRREVVTETIRRADPDVLGLQEALAEQIEYLDETFPEYRWVGVDRGLNGGRGLSEATPIFYRHGELAPIESGTFWLTDDPDPPRRRSRRPSRIVTWARFHHLETAEQVYVFNTHFTLRRGPRQVRSAEMINERIAALPEGSAVVVMGDFNAVAGRSDTWEAATGSGLRDAWQEAAERHGPPLTSHGFRAPPEDWDGWDGRIDWILVGGPVEVKRAVTVVHSVDGRYPSDHYPVSATLDLLSR